MAAVQIDQYERDLRSANTDFKRTKDARVKWSYGTRVLPGRQGKDMLGEAAASAAGGQRVKARPQLKSGEATGFTKVKHNIVKTNRATNWSMPSQRVRSSMSAHSEIEEVSRSIVELIGSPTKQPCKTRGVGVNTTTAAALAAAGGDAGCLLYSFDNTDSPPPVLTLDVFVKPNVRATEKLVEKEYEVLDDNGDAVKGRKARQVLRKAAGGQQQQTAAPATTVSADNWDDDDDFELV